MFIGTVVAIVFLLVMFGVLTVLVHLPVSIQKKLAIKDRPARPPNALERFSERLFKKHGRLIWSFVFGALVALLGSGEPWWSQAFLIGLALLIAHTLGGGGEDSATRS